MEITVATWNVLADCYARGHSSAVDTSKPNCDAVSKEMAHAASEWKYRSSLLEHCLLNCKADVICLQEVDHFADFYQACFAKRGYRALYYQRPLRKDGCIVAYNPAKFTLVSVDRVSCNDGISADSLYEFQKFEKNNVGLNVKLETLDTKQRFIVGTCHVHWNPSLPEVKLSQALYLLQRLWLFREDEDIPLILTGDFNTLPADKVYAGITQANSIYALTGALHALKYGGALYGPKTRFLCDASLSKLCKWLRVLGVNVALDAWDTGVPASSKKHLNKAKWQWSCASDGTTQPTTADETVAMSEATTDTTPSKTEESNTTTKATDQTYTARINSINAFFARAEREKRVILTTSKSLRERASCPRNFYVNPQDLEAGLIDICAQFGLELNRDRFLTVCGKCGDEVEEVSAEDPRLVNRYLPTDRAVFACVNCAQPYWWNEKAGSLPAKAMEKAEQLLQVITHGLAQRQLQDPRIVTRASVVTAAMGAEKPRVKAGTCILKDFGRTAKNPVLRDATVSSVQSDSKAAEWELQQLRLQALQLEGEGETVGEEGEGVETQPGKEDEFEMDDSEAFALEPSPVPERGAVEEASSNNDSDEVVYEDVQDEAVETEGKQGDEIGAVKTPGMTIEELTRMFENRKRSLQGQTGKEDMSPPTPDEDPLALQQQQGEEGGGDEVRLGLRSVFPVEPLLTNWNGGFQGTLDYVFVSEHWAVAAPTTVYPAVDVDQCAATVSTSLVHGTRTVPILLPAASSGQKREGTGEVVVADVFEQVVRTPQPSLQWPSDHFMVYATLVLGQRADS